MVDLYHVLKSRRSYTQENVNTKMTVTIISFYIAIGLLISFLVDMAYMQRDRGHAHFKDLAGEVKMPERIIVILLWPIVLSFAVIGIIKEQKGRKNGK
jgi:hypothetical protein